MPECKHLLEGLRRCVIEMDGTGKHYKSIAKDMGIHQSTIHKRSTNRENSGLLLFFLVVAILFSYIRRMVKLPFSAIVALVY